MANPEDTLQSYTTYYTLYLTDEGEAATGLTPMVESFWGLPSKTNYVGSPSYFAPAIEEVGDGFYFFSIDWSTFDPSSLGDVVFLVKIEAVPNIAADSDRVINKTRTSLLMKEILDRGIKVG